MTGHRGDDTRVLRVLHVEDNAGDVRLVAEALKESGILHEAYVVHDGSQAFEFLRRQGPFFNAPRPDRSCSISTFPEKAAGKYWPK